MIRPLASLLVTGGAGFIGSAFVRSLLLRSDFSGKIVNLDKCTYAGDWGRLSGFLNHPRHFWMEGDILDQPLVERLLEEHAVDAIVHFAAESHVDRSIASSIPFVETNVLGTVALLEAVRKLPSVHFHHVSTDEVYGALGEEGAFEETSPYLPNSPYAASKAASDHFVRAYGKTYGLSYTISHCSNNFGPRQYPEKFIPLMLQHALQGKPLPLYGEGKQVREWIYVDDHVEALWELLQKGKSGETYNIGGVVEKSNLELLEELLTLLSFETGAPFSQYQRLIRFVADRPGHDFRYALRSTKFYQETEWSPRTSLKEGLNKTIRWAVNK